MEDSGLGALAERVARFDPHLVIASAPSAAGAGKRFAWIELSPEPDRPSRICVGGRSAGALNPSIEDLVFVAEEAEGLIGEGGCPRAC